MLHFEKAKVINQNGVIFLHMGAGMLKCTFPELFPYLELVYFVVDCGAKWE
jgi:hypothetical protein